MIQALGLYVERVSDEEKKFYLPNLGPELPFQYTGSDMVTIPVNSGGTGLLLVGGYKQLHLSGWGVGFSDDIHLIRDKNKSGGDFEWELLRSKLKTARWQCYKDFFSSLLMLRTKKLEHLSLVISS